MFSQVNITAVIKEDASYYDSQQILSKIVVNRGNETCVFLKNAILKFCWSCWEDNTLKKIRQRYYWLDIDKITNSSIQIKYNKVKNQIQ